MSNNIYCTYLTTYSGDKLPPLYIGSTSVEKINKGYHGSVESKKYKEIWLSELSENPHLFQTKILTTHSTREEALEEEVRYQLEHDVVRSPEYINMAVANKKFIFVDYDDSEYIKKISEAGRKRYKNPEEKKKSSESQKKRYENPDERKKTSEAQKKRYKNGFINPMFGKRHTTETKLKMSESASGSKNGSYGRRWFYHPETLENIKCLPEDKPENYIPGRKLSMLQR
jgi:hypothetical protein